MSFISNPYRTTVELKREMDVEINRMYQRNRILSGTFADNLETAMVSVKIGTILAILTHDDPLSAEFVGERAPRDAIDLLHKNAKRYTILHCYLGRLDGVATAKAGIALPYFLPCFYFCKNITLDCKIEQIFRFFERAAELNIFHAMSISSMRKATDALYLKDHIRYVFYICSCMNPTSKIP